MNMNFNRMYIQWIKAKEKNKICNNIAKN
jgi:hypothetical protein